MVKKRKTRSDKGKKRTYKKNRKKARPHSVKSHTRGGPLALGSLWGDEKGLKPGKIPLGKLKMGQLKVGELYTERDKKGLMG